MKTSWRCLCKTSWIYLEDIFNTSWRRLKDVLKTSWRRLAKSSWRRLEHVLNTSWRRIAKTNILVLPRRLQDVLWRRRRKTFSRRLQDVFIRTNVCWVNVLDFPGATSADVLTKIDDVLNKKPASLNVYVGINNLQKLYKSVIKCKKKNC